MLSPFKCTQRISGIKPLLRGWLTWKLLVPSQTSTHQSYQQYPGCCTASCWHEFVFTIVPNRVIYLLLFYSNIVQILLKYYSRAHLVNHFRFFFHLASLTVLCSPEKQTPRALPGRLAESVVLKRNISPIISRSKQRDGKTFAYIHAI